MRFLIPIAVALALPACDLTPPRSPGQVADQTVLDEKVGIGVETAYQATRAAYDAGNSASYQQAAATALPLLRELVALVRGE